jgi:hypothetical protein
MQSLVFFNKEGDNYNFRWVPIDERWEGNLIFHENSNDTFKTIGIYMFERIPAFEYEAPGILKLQKFQLFNEYRFNYIGNQYSNEIVTKIESVNLDPTFYSKWVYGIDFEMKFPIGSQVYFPNTIFEFGIPDISYTVLQTKKGAIMIISNTDNRTFNNLYGNIIGLTSSYVNATITGLNAIGVYNYITPQLQETLSPWSEPDFYTKYFVDKKINVINTEKNDGIYTINNLDVRDKVYYRWELPLTQFTQSQNLAIELTLKTDLPVVYKGGLDLIGNKIYFNDPIPLTLKPGTEFTLPYSVQNPNNLVVAPIPNFIGNANVIYYPVESQVIYDNRIYECIQAFTWSATSSIFPNNELYWSEPKYLTVNTQLVTETFGQTEIHLTTNKFYYVTNFTASSLTTMATSVKTWQSDLRFFNVDFYLEDNILYSDLIYPTRYADVKYILFTQSIPNSPTFSYGTERTILERNIGVEETLKLELNEDICENFSYNIVFTDLDEYGLKIIINGQVYEEQIDFIYVGIQIDLPRTIDRTLRNWLEEHYTNLVTLGIFASLKYTGGAFSFYYNTINLTTEYPNVPLQFQVRVGITADYYIQHSEVIFFEMSNYLQLTINGRNYGQSVNVTGGTANVVEALENWVETYSEELIDWGIYITNVNTRLIFNVKRQNQRVDYTVSVGKSPLPGIDFYRIDRKMLGKFGALMTSNSIILPEGGTESFEAYPFATGQIVTINNTPYPYDNQEYNILYLGPNHLVLSYQGPFWGTTDPRCDTSPYVSIAFSTGFGATGCLPVIVPTASFGGNFNLLQFNTAFSLTNLSNNVYSFLNYSLVGNTNLVDIIYLQSAGAMYILGDKISVVDANTTLLIKTIDLPGLTPVTSKLFKWNSFNNYLYCLTRDFIYVVDTNVNDVVYTITLNNQPYTIEVSDSNGDVWVSYDSTNKVDIWYFNNFTNTPSKTITTTSNTRGLVFNSSENDIYVSQADNNLIRIDANTRNIFSTYSISGLNPEIFYDTINSSVYYFDSVGMGNVNNNTLVNVFSGTSSFKDIVYNHVSGVVVVSQGTKLTQVSLSNTVSNSYTYTDAGKLAVSNYDGETYLVSTSNPVVYILSKNNSSIVRAQTINAPVSKMIFDPERNSMFGIQPGVNGLVEIQVVLASYYQQLLATFSTNFNNQLGALSSNYVPHPDVWLNTRDYIRKPRENYNDEPFVKYVWKWETDEYPEMFLYDYSGNQLPTGGSYAYTGQKPLDIISLNRNPNKDITKVSLPEYQQTIFEEVVTTLDHVDSEDNFSIVPEPLETFLGFKSDDEGPLSSTLLLIKREDINFTIIPTSTNYNFIEIKNQFGSAGAYATIKLDVNSTEIFTFNNNNVPRGLKPGQLIQVSVVDITNTKNKFISLNNGKIFKILRVSTRELQVTYVDLPEDEKNMIPNYPKSGVTTYLSVNIKVIDKEIGRFLVSGQTEIEDVRYKTELSNVGQNVGPEDVYIFKPYDINEQGVDWVYLNSKRKEMLLVRHDIYPYVGSYKAIINAINFFGYNDLELYEYYRNINIDSSDFYKLFKIEIPDIFDNSVAGWNANDFIKHTLPNKNFQITNLFNLTYKITDKEGNNVLLYSLAEVIIKLQGLKFWLQRNIIPITHRILDITGRADWVNSTGIVHRNYDAKILNVRQSMTPIDFALTEAYLMPVNSGSTVYRCVVDFYSPTASETPDYFNVLVRTYKTYKEWNPFTTYNIGDKVTYFGQVYESKIDRNKLKNPRKYEAAPLWNVNTNYQLGQFVKYDEYVYQWTSTQSSFKILGTVSEFTGATSGFNLSSDGTNAFTVTLISLEDAGRVTTNLLSPYADIQTNGAFASWRDNTEWRKMNIEPVQYLTEFRTATHSYSFTIDSNIDPFVVIEVTSDNGYGQNFTMKKNYEIRGLNDLFQGYEGDTIEPFSPIVQIQSPFIPNPPISLPGSGSGTTTGTQQTGSGGTSTL